MYTHTQLTNGDFLIFVKVDARSVARGLEQLLNLGVIAPVVPPATAPPPTTTPPPVAPTAAAAKATGIAATPLAPTAPPVSAKVTSAPACVWGQT